MVGASDYCSKLLHNSSILFNHSKNAIFVPKIFEKVWLVGGI